MIALIVYSIHIILFIQETLSYRLLCTRSTQNSMHTHWFVWLSWLVCVCQCVCVCNVSRSSHKCHRSFQNLIVSRLISNRICSVTLVIAMLTPPYIQFARSLSLYSVVLRILCRSLDAYDIHHTPSVYWVSLWHTPIQILALLLPILCTPVLTRTYTYC
jgi:hypothetical protein